jgi:hypothetical protein
MLFGVGYSTMTLTCFTLYTDMYDETTLKISVNTRKKEIGN